ncbi:uncharacterized protein LOC132283377 [Cornus florida]|uniref:uncharacterized protein LOC132283377 n=1 Tax=Cornus florida TaxID=4283 RepID=UPI0028A08D11|nr:uncharacterized protein LOC132283377 [Cornus florida]
MAATYSSSPALIIQKACPIKKHVTRVLMIAQNQISVKKTFSLQIRSSFKEKVFEDQSKGIICYRDVKGEITCEGFDEGPRLQQFSIMACNPRDADIIDLLQKCWLQIAEDVDLDHNGKGVGGQKDFNWNGFNTFY